MPAKFFTREEAIEIARHIVKTSDSPDEIRVRLNGAGFNEKAAIIGSDSMGYFMAININGEIINV